MSKRKATVCGENYESKKIDRGFSLHYMDIFHGSIGKWNMIINSLDAQNLLK